MSPPLNMLFLHIICYFWKCTVCAPIKGHAYQCALELSLSSCRDFGLATIHSLSSLHLQFSLRDDHCQGSILAQSFLIKHIYPTIASLLSLYSNMPRKQPSALSFLTPFLTQSNYIFVSITSPKQLLSRSPLIPYCQIL